MGREFWRGPLLQDVLRERVIASTPTTPAALAMSVTELPSINELWR